METFNSPEQLDKEIFSDYSKKIISETKNVINTIFPEDKDYAEIQKNPLKSIRRLARYGVIYLLSGSEESKMNELGALKPNLINILRKTSERINLSEQKKIDLDNYINITEKDFENKLPSKIMRDLGLMDYKSITFELPTIIRDSYKDKEDIRKASDYFELFG